MISTRSLPRLCVTLRGGFGDFRMCFALREIGAASDGAAGRARAGVRAM